jgi:NADPH2:quinone reductase
VHAITIHEFGPPEVLQLEETVDPMPDAGEVRIVVHAAGVHLLDTALRAGTTGGSPLPVPALPTIPGREVAGVVDLVGIGVDGNWLGRKVVAHLGGAPGGYAELAVVEVDQLLRIPEGLDAARAVAMVGTGRTALGILEAAELTADDVVLVPAAAGGLGSLLVQAAHAAGCRVVGLAGGAAKVARVLEQGADAAVDYDDPGWVDAARAALGERGATVLLDGVAGDVGRAALGLVAPGGRLVPFGWSSGERTGLTADDLAARGITEVAALGPRMQQRPGGIRGLAEQALAEAGAGRLVPLLTRFPLEEAAAAHAALEGRRTVGKVVLEP